VFYVSGHYGGFDAEFLFVTDVAVTLTVQTQLKIRRRTNSKRNQSAAERIAAQRIQRLPACPARRDESCSGNALEHEKQFVVSVKNGKEEMAMKRNKRKRYRDAVRHNPGGWSLGHGGFDEFLSQSETWASMNYRLMTQARYGAMRRAYIQQLTS